MRRSAFVSAFLFLIAHVAGAAEPKEVLVITSAPDRPYEVMQPLFYTHQITSSLLTGPLGGISDALSAGRKVLEEGARQKGGDALINTSMQVVLYPVPRGEQLGVVVFYGTLVKLK